MDSALQEICDIYCRVRDRFTWEYRVVRTSVDFDRATFDLDDFTQWVEWQTQSLSAVASPLLKFLEAASQTGEMDPQEYILLFMETLKGMVAWREEIETYPAPSYFYETRHAIRTLGDVVFAQMIGYEMLDAGPVTPPQIPIKTAVSYDEARADIAKRYEAFVAIESTEPMAADERLSELSLLGRERLPADRLRYRIERDDVMAGSFRTRDDAWRYAKKLGWGSYRVSELYALPDCTRCGKNVSWEQTKKSWYTCGSFACPKCCAEILREMSDAAIAATNARVTAAIQIISCDKTISAAVSLAEPFFERVKIDFMAALQQRRTLPERPGIYEVRFELDDGACAVYVGQSVNVYRRIGQHLKAILACHYGDGRPPLQSLMDVVAPRIESLLKSDHAARASVLAWLYEQWPFIRYLRRNYEKVEWQNPVATEVAKRIGPRANVSVVTLQEYRNMGGTGRH